MTPNVLRRRIAWLRRLLSPTLWNQMERANAETAVRRARVGAIDRSRLDARGNEALTVAEGLLSTAEAAVSWNNQQGVWHAIHDIDEELVWTLSKEEAAALGIEISAKFGGTPSAGKAGAAAVELLKGLEKPDELAKMDAHTVRSKVKKAVEMRHQHWEVKYHGASMLAGRVALLIVVLSVCLSTLLFLGASKLSPLPAPVDKPLFLLAIAFFGMLGGALSSILSATTGDKVLPDAAREAPWHFARPLFGAAAAVIITVVLAAGGFGVTANNNATYLGFAAAAGFSEALLVKMMNKVSDKADAKK